MKATTSAHHVTSEPAMADRCGSTSAQPTLTQERCTSWRQATATQRTTPSPPKFLSSPISVTSPDLSFPFFCHTQEVRSTRPSL